MHDFFKLTMNKQNLLFTIFSSMVIGILVADPAESPRQKLLMDSDWRFYQGDPVDVGQTLDFLGKESDLMKQGEDSEAKDTSMRKNLPDVMKENTGAGLAFVKPEFDDSAWRILNLPHDYAIEQSFGEKDNNGKGSRHLDAKDGSAIGWYRRTFELPSADQGKKITVQFDGAYRNSIVWFNGHCLGRKPSGYTSFVYDLTPYARFGGKNTLVVRTDASANEGWFYEGAGIYRHVWLQKTSPLHVAQWGTYVTSVLSGKDATLTVETTLENNGDKEASGTLVTKILDDTGNEVAKTAAPFQTASGQHLVVTQNLQVADSKLWSPESPTLYKAISRIETNGVVSDLYETPFGIRTVTFDPQKGFSLNGQHRFIKGVCNHQDFAGVGVAVPDSIEKDRVAIMREMGADGWRMSHNPPNTELLDECDRQGMMVMDETRRFGKYPEPLSDLETMIRRDRNHPSIVIWSLGNEEMKIQGTQTGADIIKVTQDLAHKLDPSRLCTIAQNHAEDKKGFVTVVDVVGMNYLGLWGAMDKFHAEHPERRFIGSEEASTVTTRGEYFDDFARAYKSSYDSHANTPGWGASAEEWWRFYQTRPWVGGAFAWTGFDYRGEPTPYKWPNVSSHFGIVDTCVFPKDIYYYYKAWWTPEPLLHLYPHWNWDRVEHRTIRVKVSGNSEKAEVTFNGVRNKGKSTLSPEGTEWPPFLYQSGELIVKAYQGNTLVASKTIAVNGTNSITVDLDPVTVKPELSGTAAVPQYDPTHPDSALTSAASTNAVVAPKDSVTVSVSEAPIDLWVESNCDEVELFVNGVSHGRVKVQQNSHAEWDHIPYVPGSIEAKGYKNGKFLVSEKIETTGEPLQIRLHANCQELKGDGEETSLIAVDSLDEKGRFVPTATNGISFAIKGPGKILGVGNGDPSSHESDIEPTRHLFNGKALVIVQSTGGAGTIELIASGQGLRPAVLSLPVKDAPRRPSVP